MSDVPPGLIHVWWADHHVADQSWLRILDSDECQRWEAYRRQIDRDRFIVGVTMVRALFARALGVPPADVRLDRRCPRCDRPHGKVRLAGTAPIEISVSHSGTWVVLGACHTYPIGVDVEVINPSIDHLSIGGRVLSVRAHAASLNTLAESPSGEVIEGLSRYSYLELEFRQAIEGSARTRLIATAATRWVRCAWQGRSRKCTALS